MIEIYSLKSVNLIFCHSLQNYEILLTHIFYPTAFSTQRNTQELEKNNNNNENFNF
jgi:hypothetical protein